MLHVLVKPLITLGVAVIGVGIGYFSTAAYYEGNPQSVEESGELSARRDTIGWENRDSLLSVSAYENSRAWKNRERSFRESSDTPSAEPFKQLKKSIDKSKDSDVFRKACWQVYRTSKSDNDVSSKASEAKKYCGVASV